MRTLQEEAGGRVGGVGGDGVDLDELAVGIEVAEAAQVQEVARAPLKPLDLRPRQGNVLALRGAGRRGRAAQWD